MSKAAQSKTWNWNNTAGLNSGMQMFNSTSSSFMVNVGDGTSAIPPTLEPMDLRFFGRTRRTEEEHAFDLVTEQYVQGELTLGEAADLLGVNRYEYQDSLALRGLRQHLQKSTQQELDTARKLLEQFHR